MEGDRPPVGGSALEPLPPHGGWRDGVFAAMPVVAIAFLVGLLGLLLWLVDRDERDRQRLTLVSDALWVEQTLRFQLAVDEDAIARLALDLGGGPAATAAFLDRARLHVASSPEVQAIVWTGADGRIRAAVPDGSAGRPDGAAPVATLRQSRVSARPTYRNLRRDGEGGLLVDLSVAVPEGAAMAGVLVATLSVSTLVTRHVPWWIAESYAVRLIGTDGAILAEKARVEPFDPAVSHRIAFDPPLAGTVLEIAPYRVVSSFSDNSLYAAIVGLAVFAVVSLLVLQRHVAHRRRAERRLVTEAAFRRAMEDSLTVGMRARDLRGRILYVNPAFCRMVGFTAGELVGRAPPMPYWIPDEIAETQARHDAQIRNLTPKSWETRFRRSDGTVFDALIYEAPLVDETGVVRGWMGSIIDITERKAAVDFARRQAESLQRTGRLVTLGEMASSLAHELNQPLAAISSYATGSLNLLSDGEPDLAALRGAIEKASLQAQRAGHIIRRIQDFVRKREPRFDLLSIGEVVADTVAFARFDARGAGIGIAVTVAADLPPVRADRILVEQILLNLMRNGMEAMAGMGGERVLDVAVGTSGGDVVVEVADRGAGIDPAVEGRLFDAFVSTKGEGMGMGLNICRSIVELHEGRLSHRPRTGGGTVFAVTLPAVVLEAA